MAATAQKAMAIDHSKALEPSGPPRRLHEQAGHKVIQAAYSTKAGTLRFLGRFQPKGGAQSVLAANEILLQHNPLVDSQVIPVEAKIQSSAELTLNMYRQAFGADDPYLGQYYCSYGSAGYNFSAEVGFDFGPMLSLLAPPLCITAKPSLKGDVERVKHLLLVIQNAFPAVMPRPPITSAVTPSVAPRELILPLCFMALYGVEKGGGVQFTFEAGLSVGVPINIDGHELSLNLLSGTVSVAGKCRFIHLEDQLPGWYRSVSDKELEEDVYRLASPSKRELKRRIDAFREMLRKKIKGIVPKEYHPVTTESLKKLNDLLNTSLLIKPLRLTNLKPSTVEVTEWLDNIAKPIEDLNHDGVVFSDQDNTELQDYIKGIRDALTDAKVREVVQRRAKEPVPLKQHLDLVETSQVPAQKTDKCHTHIAVWGIEGGASAKTGDSVSQGFDLGMLTQMPGAENLGSSASAEVEAQTEVKGDIRFMSSRYQTYVAPPVGESLLFTQDTKITYTQIVWNATAGASANLPFDVSVGRERSWEKVFKNDMNYYSATAFWREAGAGHQATLLPGSGMSVGISMSSAKIQDLVQNINNPVFDKKLKKYHQNLALTPTEFKAFLSTIPTDLFTEDFVKEHPYVLIEAAFKFNKAQTATIDPKGKLESLTDKFFRDSNKKFTYRRPDITELDSIRCRVRQGSDANYSRSVFTLGVQIVSPELGVELSRIERAGNLFIEDVFVYVPDPSFVPAIQTEAAPIASSPSIPSPGQRKRGGPASPAGTSTPASVTTPEREAEVPPTVLLPHTFELE